MLACEKQFNQKLYYTLCSDSTKMKYHFVKAVAAAILTNTCNNSVTSLKDLLTSSLLILAYTVLILIIFLKFRLLLALLNAIIDYHVYKTLPKNILSNYLEFLHRVSTKTWAAIFVALNKPILPQYGDHIGTLFQYNHYLSRSRLNFLRISQFFQYRRQISHVEGITFLFA